MTFLQVRSFADYSLADTALVTTQELYGQGDLDLSDAAVVFRDDLGTIQVSRVVQSGGSATTNVVTGALFGAFIGALATIPVVGFALGGAVGILFAKLETPRSIDSDTAAYISGRIAAGRALLVLLVDESGPGAAKDALEKVGGREIAAAEITPDDEAAIMRALKTK